MPQVSRALSLTTGVAVWSLDGDFWVFLGALLTFLGLQGGRQGQRSALACSQRLFTSPLSLF